LNPAQVQHLIHSHLNSICISLDGEKKGFQILRDFPPFLREEEIHIGLDGREGCFQFMEAMPINFVLVSSISFNSRLIFRTLSCGLEFLKHLQRGGPGPIQFYNVGLQLWVRSSTFFRDPFWILSTGGSFVKVSGQISDLIPGMNIHGLYQFPLGHSLSGLRQLFNRPEKNPGHDQGE